MNKASEFFKANKYPIFWTIGYIFAMWAILKGMFNFSIFSASNWSHLMHAELRGFGGFVFGILILAAMPIYIATTMIILRTGKPLFSIPKPQIFSKIISIITPSPAEPENPPATDETAPQPESESPSNDFTLPAGIPMELRKAFLRAHQKAIYSPESYTPDTPPAPQTPDENIPSATENDFPLPADFDFDSHASAPEYSTDIMSAPTFTDINFDTPSDTTAPQETDAPQTTPELIKVADFLRSASQEFIVEDNIILTQKCAIATHTDPDFWVADDENWFAAGKSKPSPVAAATAAATTHGLRPVLYLGADNIMDLENKRTAWTKAGVLIINDLNTLPI